MMPICLGISTVFLGFLTLLVVGYDWKALNLPSKHIPYYFTNNENISTVCRSEKNCPWKKSVATGKCWGYEEGCSPELQYGTFTCSGDSRGWAPTKEEQEKEFWKSADFGIVREQRNQLKYFCKPRKKGDSSLKCSQYTRYCEAQNIYMDFRKVDMKGSKDRFNENIFTVGKIGGHCELNKKALQQEGGHKSPLQSWFAEMEHFRSFKFHPINDGKCDVVITKPTYLMKLDAGVNLYHHFCDFVNLYLSQHVNNSFSTDINIVMWDTSQMHYSDLFSVVWKMFSDHPIIRLHEFEGKRVCFKNAVFPLLPRMRFGLFYNMPLMPGCHGSTFFQAFHEHLIHRLNIKQYGPLENKIRVTILSRKTSYRNILNEDELIAALRKEEIIEVKKVEYNWKSMEFLKQIEQSHNSDIFVGLHGAGLTHMLFQPIWGVVIELYNCEDKNCYLDLARLRGVRYMTWQDKTKMIQEDEGHHPTLGAHAKFTNYSFDVDEFVRLIMEAVDHVQNHKEFFKAYKKKYVGKTTRDEL